MKRTLFLHIGTHRTATSSVQKYMKLNAAKLQARGWFYPYNVQRHFDVVNRIFSGRTSAAEIAAEIEKRADSKGAPIHSVVLSDEDICMRRDLSPLLPFRDRFDVKIVFMLRRQDLWIESWYQQNVKWQWNPQYAHLSFPDFLNRRDDFFWMDYAERVAHLESLFGDGNVICRVFEKSEMPQGPVVDFCEAIGLTDREDLTPAPHVNASLSPVMSEFMRNLPLDELPNLHRRIFEQACVRADAEVRRQSGPQSALFLDFTTRRNLLAEYEAGNDLLARKVFGRDQLFREPLPAPDASLAPQRLPEDSYVVMQMLVQPFVRALAKLRAVEIEAQKSSTPKA